MADREHVRRLHKMQIEQIGLKVRRGHFIRGLDTGETLKRAVKTQGRALGVKAHVLVTEFQHHGLRGAVGERQHAGALGRGLDGVGVREARPVGHRAVG